MGLDPKHSDTEGRHPVVGGGCERGSLGHCATTFAPETGFLISCIFRRLLDLGSWLHAPRFTSCPIPFCHLQPPSRTPSGCSRPSTLSQNSRFRSCSWDSHYHLVNRASLSYPSTFLFIGWYTAAFRGPTSLRDGALRSDSRERDEGIHTPGIINHSCAAARAKPPPPLGVCHPCRHTHGWCF